MTNVDIMQGSSSSTVQENFNNVAAVESIDEIQLTELLPVKQSAIQKSRDNEKEEIVLDAFKALRREGNKNFSTTNRNEFDGEIIEKSVDELNLDYNVDKEEDEDEDADRMEYRMERINRGFDKRMRIVSKTRLDRRQNDDDKISTKKSFDVKINDYEKSLEKNGVFNDEIYVFRNENDYQNTNEVIKLQGKKNHGIIKLKLRKKTKIVEKSTIDNVKKIKLKSSNVVDEGLREKIDAIIQANYVIERKNNNTTIENLNNSTKIVNLNEICKFVGEESSSSSSSLKKHRCAICNARFKGSGGLRTHYKVVHAAGPTFTCDDCGKEFPLKERLKLHVRTHTGYKPYKCTECDKSFARGGQLVQHRRTHTQVKPYSCLLCPGTFSCAANLALHVKRHNGQKDHKCEICGRAFVRRDALKKHLECLHKDVKSFLCVICNKTFKGHLPQHMRTHAQDRPHGCATCGQRFAQKSQLTVHQRTHSGQRPFRCLVCWQAFAHSTALKLHTRRHTGERPFKCAECNAGFTQLPHWKKHMRCVHGRTDPYCCKNCKTFFRIKNDLETHEKSCILNNVGDTSSSSSSSGCIADIIDSADINNRIVNKSVLPKYRIMTVEKMRLLLAVLFKRISKPERLDELGFGKRLIDEVLKDSLISAGKDPATDGDQMHANEFDILKQNLASFLEWTVPREHWEAFKKLNKSPEEILETLTVSQ